MINYFYFTWFFKPYWVVQLNSNSYTTSLSISIPLPCSPWRGGLQNHIISNHERQDLMLEHLQFAVNALKNIGLLWNIMFFHDGSESNQGV